MLGRSHTSHSFAATGVLIRSAMGPIRGLSDKTPARATVSRWRRINEWPSRSVTYLQPSGIWAQLLIHLLCLSAVFSCFQNHCTKTMCSLSSPFLNTIPVCLKHTHTHIHLFKINISNVYIDSFAYFTAMLLHLGMTF